MEDTKRRVLITENGQQIVVESGSSVEVDVFLPNDTVIDVVPLEVNDQEFATIKEQAVTNDIPADILSNKKADNDK